MPWDCLYAVWTWGGIIGTGFWVWKKIKHESRVDLSLTLNEKCHEHIFLTLGISWFIGYFLYEGLLNTLAISQLFYPLTITFLAGALTLHGWLRLYRGLKGREFSSPATDDQPTPLWEKILLMGMAAFLLFWNFYPTFDVDSLTFYFPSIQRMIEHGGRYFSRFEDIRYNVPMGENILYAVGFAIHPHSTIFPQMMQGLSKLMILFSVYGAARTLRAGSFAVLAAGFIISEEHLIASGSNHSVHINPILAAGVLLLSVSLFLFILGKKKEYAFLAILTAFSIVTCKYLGTGYIAITFLTLIAAWILNKDTRSAWGLNLTTQKMTIGVLFVSALFCILPYLYNGIVTGSPIFPALLGPFHSWCYDAEVSELGKIWHFHLSIPDAFKNFSVFMVWPGVLASKILLPLGMFAGLTAMIAEQKNQKDFMTGLCFFTMTIIVILLQQLYMVFEMRYYRFGIGVSALAAVFFLKYLFDTWTRAIRTPNILQRIFRALVILLISLYCFRYSFDVMGQSRASARDILDYITGKKSEAQIIQERYPEYTQTAQDLKRLNLDPSHLGYFLSFDWPHIYYPVKGKNIRLLHSAAFPTETYYNEGLFAKALLDQDIRYIMNQEARESYYPILNGAVNAVLQQCGKPLLASRQDMIGLSIPCLEKMSLQADPQDAEQRLQAAMTEMRAYPKYDPFVPPNYGGSPKIIK